MSQNEVNAAHPAVVTDSVIQARGVWHRPNVTKVETNLEGICSVLDTFQKTGINLVFLETFFHGMTVYRSSLIPYYTGFDEFDYSPYPDYLSAFVAEAGKRNIEVHAWVEDFYIGVDGNYFTRYLPQWLMLTADGANRQSEGAEYGGYLFLDPANPEVRQYLVRFYDELLTKFPDVAGLNLDYIRYPLSSRGDDTGFTEAAMDGFAEEVGLTFPENATREEMVQLVSAQYDRWVQYRADQVTTFVGQVYDMVKTDHPGVLLSTAVFPEQGKSFGDKKQDFNTWLARGYLDIITPMAYYDDIPTLKSALEAMLPGLSACYCYAGISPTYHNLSNERVVQQMQTVIETGADGFVFFGSQSILNAPGYIELLECMFGQRKTILPHGSVDALFAATAQVVGNKLAEAGEPAQNVESLLAQLANAAQLADEASLDGMEAACKQLHMLVNYNLDSWISEENVTLIAQDLQWLLRWMQVKTTRLSVKADGKQDENPPQDTEIPEETTPETKPETPQPGKQPNQLVRKIGFGAAIAALAAATAAIFHIRRKGRDRK